VNYLFNSDHSLVRLLLELLFDQVDQLLLLFLKLLDLLGMAFLESLDPLIDLDLDFLSYLTVSVALE